MKKAVTAAAVQGGDASDDKRAVAPSAAPSDELVSSLSALSDHAQYSALLRCVLEQDLNGVYPEVFREIALHKESSIKRICEAHYLEFLSSIQQLMRLKADMQQLRVAIMGVRSQMEASGQRFLSALEQLQRRRYQRLQINQLRDQLLLTLSLQELLCGAERQIQQQEFFSAIQTLQSLSTNYLPLCRQHAIISTTGPDFIAEFLSQFAAQTLLLEERIKALSKADFLDWCGAIKARALTLGRASLRTAEQQVIRLEASKQQARKRLLQSLRSSLARTAGVQQPVHASEDGEDELQLERVEAAIQEPVNFAAVLSCLDVFSALQVESDFVLLYKGKRRAQLIAAMELPSGKASAAVVHDFLAAIAGFFVIESALVAADTPLMSSSEAEQLWELCLPKVRAVLLAQAQSANTVPAFVTLKRSLLALRAVLRAHSLSGSGLSELLAALVQQRYQAYLFARYADEIDDIFANERWEPLTLKSAADFQRLISDYGLTPRAHTGVLKLPASMPFSSAVPKLCARAVSYMHDLYLMLDTDVASQLTAGVDRLLIERVNAATVESMAKNQSLHISQAVQLSVNALALGEACAFLQAVIAIYTLTESFSHNDALPVSSQQQRLAAALSALLSAPDDQNAHSLTAYASLLPLQLASSTIFQQTGARCESFLFELIDVKIDAFLSGLSHYDWAPANIAHESSDFVVDLIAYLNTTFAILDYVSESVREAVYFTSCRHIASFIAQYLLNSVKKCNVLALHNLGLDLEQLETFASHCPIANLVETFGEVRQLLDLFLVLDLESLLDPNVRTTRLPHLSLQKITKMLDKIKDFTVFPGAKIPPHLAALKRKQIDVILKKLLSQR